MKRDKGTKTTRAAKTTKATKTAKVEKLALADAIATVLAGPPEVIREPYDDGCHTCGAKLTEDDLV